jgi:hypothetical protein
MIIKGVAHPEERRSFKLWVENRVPTVVFEVTSKKSRKDDTVVKLELYARLGVLEYYIFDPLGEYLDPRFRAYRPENGQYVPIAPEPNGDFISQELGVGLRNIGTRLRLVDLTTGELFPDPSEDPSLLLAAIDLREKLIEEYKARVELERKAEGEANKLEAEKQRAEALEAEVKRLRALLAKQGNGDPLNPGD